MPGVSSVRFWSKLDKARGHCRSALLRVGLIQHLPGRVIEIAEAVGLDPIGDDREQQMPRQMIGRRSLKHA